jgi:hypothetical protein
MVQKRGSVVYTQAGKLGCNVNPAGNREQAPGPRGKALTRANPWRWGAIKAWCPVMRFREKFRLPKAAGLLIRG